MPRDEKTRTCDGPTCEVVEGFEWANLAWLTGGENKGNTTYPEWTLLWHSHECYESWEAAQASSH